MDSSTSNLERLPNNETRAHMADDLARYLFAASVWLQAFRRSPKSYDFPDALAPNHANWFTGKFDDRYRVQVAERPLHHSHESHREGRPLLYSSRSGPVPKSHRKGSGPSPDVPGQLLLPWQPFPTVHSGG